jgi:alanyl-tRNA synthetase
MTAELREGFLSFFESKGHKRLPSASLVPPPDDPSTLLTVAGMQPLKPYLRGLKEPPTPLLTTAQKSFRTQDIDEVGLDGHHLTFFEMLGNFSIGEYFKEGAIELAKEFVLEHMRIDWDRIWVTVFAGDPELGLGEDEVAIEGWASVGMPRERIVALPRSENFWQAADTGPCGPDSELYYDRGEEHGCGFPDCAPGCTRCERFLEFWNLVFMEFELHEDGTLTPLPKQNIDTGMGLERAASVLQGVMSVYETDAYQTIMDWIAGESGTRYGENETATKAHRVLADHGRSMTFLLGDGVTPSNEGRGYVLRRIIRRAVVHGHDIGLADFLPSLAEIVIEQMGGVYPELVDNRRVIRELLHAEEERFGRTLDVGEKLFEQAAASRRISGDDAFRLHDTYGYPIEVTLDRARARGIPVDEDGFARLMEEQRVRSRAGAKEEETRAAEFARAADFGTEFVGYEKTDVLTQIGALEQVGDRLFLAKLRASPFYPEGGGQVTDAGFIEHEETGARATLREAHRLEDDQVLLFEGDGFAAGDRVRAVVPWSVRFPTMANHTATHLLHKALRDVLGEHVRQAGSAVRPDKLRFDFTYGQALSHEEREEVERQVNERIFQNRPVRAYVTPIEEARRLGAMMLFGEKYGDQVRVVEIDDYSRELCGGTHVRSTAEIGPFVILSEGSVGAGARRIEAVTAGEAYATLRAAAAQADELRLEFARARKEQKAAAAAGPAVEIPEPKAVIDGVHVVVEEIVGLDADGLLKLSDRVKQKSAPAAVVLGSRDDGRVHLVANFDRSLAKRGLDANKVIREAAAVVGGGGGGRSTMARAGGKQPELLPEALATAERLIVQALA